MRRKNPVVSAIFFGFLSFVVTTPSDVLGQDGTAASASGGASKAARLINLPQTGQTKSYGTDDDGKLRRGIAWPNPRFTNNKDETITDNLTGLMWTYEARTAGPAQCSPYLNKEWKEALQHIKCLNEHKYAGYDDWRLPNVNELESLVNVDQTNSAIWLTAQGFRNVQQLFYWTSTTDVRRPELAWVVVMYSGNVFSRDKKGRKVFPLWPVRSGGSTSSAKYALPQTGQTLCYSAKGEIKECGRKSVQDAALRRGVAWPNPRFTVKGECVTDTLTGLMWVKRPKDTSRTWEDALAFSNGLSLCGFTDWRLPNRNELRSLVNYGQKEPAEWLNDQGFDGVKDDDYWTSTAYEDRPGNAWVVNLEYGHVVAGRKDRRYNVFPVRDGN